MPAKSPNARPRSAEFGLMRAALAQAGVSQEEIKKAIGDTVKGRTRIQITADLLAWLSQLSKPLV